MKIKRLILTVLFISAVALFPFGSSAGPPMFGMDLTSSPSSLIPDMDDTYDIGATGLEWKDLYIDGTAYIDSIEADTIGIGVTPTANHNMDILMSATDINAIKIDGTTNDYTSAGTTVAFQLDRDINRGTSSVSNAAGWQSYLNQKHTDAALTGDREMYGSISRIDNQGAITNTTATNYQYWSNGAHNTAKIDPAAVFDTDSTGILELAITGTYGYAFGDFGWTINDTSGGSPANTVVASGLRSFVENQPTLGGTAAVTVINAGLYIETILGNTVGTSIGAGLYIPNGAIVGSDANWGIYDLSDLGWYNSGKTDLDGILTIQPDGTNEVFQVNDGTLDFTDGNAGTAGTVTVDSSGNLSYNKNFAAVDLDGIIGSNTPAAGIFTRLSNATTTVTAAGPTDDLDVSGVNTVKIDTTSNNVTIGGVTGCVDGQTVKFVVINATNNAVLENEEGTGNQDLYLESGADETKTAVYGGWVFECDGTHLRQASDSKAKWLLADVTDVTVTAAEVNVLDDGLTTNILVGGGAGVVPVWGTDLPTAITIGLGYIYRVGGTDVADNDVVDTLTITNISQVQDISATASEINTPLDGALVTLTEFRELETIGATTISANQWAMLGGVAETLGSAELDILDGVTGVTAAELSYIGDVTSLIQAQIDLKAPLASPIFTGNVGIGVTPEAWHSSATAFQFGTTGVLSNNTDGYVRFGENFYYDSVDNRFEYITTSHAAALYIGAGTFGFNVAASGTADTAISWTTALTIENDGDALFAQDLAASGTTINFTTSGTTLTVGVGADNGTVSAGVFTDRTKQFEGDALAELGAIRSKGGEIDHTTLPEFAQAHLTRDITEDVEEEVDGKLVTKKVKVGEEIIVERNLGAMVSMLTVAVQQLTARIEQLKHNK